MKVSEKMAKKIRFLETELQVKDAVIRNLLMFITEHKIQVPDTILETIATLYGSEKEIN
jgi:hypothetical protein